MKEMIDVGYIYIAQPPLFRIKQGSQEIYVDKEIQLEELLLRDKLEQIAVSGNGGGKTKGKLTLSQAKYQRFQRLYKEYEGWNAKLRALYGHSAVDYVRSQTLLEKEIKDHAAFSKFLKTKEAAAKFDRLEVVGEDESEGTTSLKVTDKRTGVAHAVEVKTELLSSREVASMRDLYSRMKDLVGEPPFLFTMGKKEHPAESFDEVTTAVLSLAKEGINLQRFKGLGEMNPEQLWETTMNPDTRTLLRVTLEDAAAADEIFTTLMGDKVEPRRAFIESNARQVRFLDI